MIRKYITAETKYDYYIKHLIIINPLLPVKLSNKEIEIVALFMTIDKDRFSSENKKYVRETLSLSYAGLSNHITRMKEKGILIELNNNLEIPNILFPNENIEYYQFKLELRNGN